MCRHCKDRKGSKNNNPIQIYLQTEYVYISFLQLRDAFHVTYNAVSISIKQTRIRIIDENSSRNLRDMIQLYTQRNAQRVQLIVLC